MALQLTRPETDLRDLYLELMKRCLTYYIWGETLSPVRGHGRLKKALYAPIQRALASRNLGLVRRLKFDPRARAEGLDFPELAHTMVGLKRLTHLQDCIQDVVRRGVAGDVIECGVWRGGATIFMRAVLKALDVTDRSVWVADSFEGHPAPDLARYPADKDNRSHWFDYQRVSLDEVRRNFAAYDLLDDQVRFLKGFFSETLPGAPIRQLALIRLDCVMYGSTTDALEHLYPKLSIGGHLICDDYGHVPEARAAVDDFRRRYGIMEEMRRVDSTEVAWQRRA